jgi:hypothetical protein
MMRQEDFATDTVAVFVGMIVSLITRATQTQASSGLAAAVPLQGDPFDRLERPLPRRGMPTWLLVSLIVGGLTLAACCGFGLLTLNVISRVGQKAGVFLAERDRLIGTWDMVEIDGSASTSVDFRKDGTVIVRKPGQEPVSGQWKHHDIGVLELIGVGDGVYQLTVTETELTLIQRDGTKDRFRRASARAAP